MIKNQKPGILLVVEEKLLSILFSPNTKTAKKNESRFFEKKKNGKQVHRIGERNDFNCQRYEDEEVLQFRGCRM